MYVGLTLSNIGEYYHNIIGHVRAELEGAGVRRAGFKTCLGAWSVPVRGWPGSRLSGKPRKLRRPDGGAPRHLPAGVQGGLLGMIIIIAR